MKEKNGQKKILICFLLVIFIVSCIMFCVIRLFGTSDVIYAQERADTGFGKGYKEKTVIKSDLEGAVRKPGLITLRGDRDRLGDAIKAAGGYTGNADRSQINLALCVADGMKIVIPAIGEDFRIENPGSGEGTSSLLGVKINVNTASSEELQKIPGIGPSYAQRIIDYRENIAPFARPEDLLAVKGIGKKRLANMTRYIKF